jgi:hypothetical protein
MRKASTWVWIAVALVNLGVGAVISHTCAFMARTYADLMGVTALPILTERVLAVPWWPYGIAAIAFLAAVASVLAKQETKVATVLIAGLLLAEIVALAFTALGLCLPLYVPHTVLTP